MGTGYPSSRFSTRYWVTCEQAFQWVYWVACEQIFPVVIESTGSSVVDAGEMKGGVFEAI